ncbi:MAG: carboxyl-terminal processing protease [Chthoniobacter sp.]|jgi:C-terminal processing protease CtpA/Prc|nr:carboxyl-terminal processing protease [Chthoniobacter sp.]
MNRLVLLGFISSALFAQSPDPIEALSPADVQQALTLLKSSYAKPEAFSNEAIARATLRGLIEHLSPGVSLGVAAKETVEPSPFRSEILNGNAGYLRLGNLTHGDFHELDDALKSFREKATKSVVLDLRATAASSDYESAAEVIKRFCPKGKLLFTLKKSPSKSERVFTSNIDPAFQGLIVVIVDEGSAGASEVIAAVLRRETKALVVGGKTTGQAVEISELPLTGGGILRVAVAEVAMPDGTAIYPVGVKPDVAVTILVAAKKEVMHAALEKGVAPLLKETERARFNEASLVAGVNPELDAAEAAQRQKEKPAAPLRDVQLQRALDMITTIGILQPARAEK